MQILHRNDIAMTQTKKTISSTSLLPGESEKEYLDRQMAQAKRAIGETLGSMKDEVKTVASPVAWTREHPWVAVAASAAAGVAAALVLTPKRGESVKDQWYKVKVKLAGDGAEASAEVEPPRKGSFLGAALATAFAVLKPIAIQAFQAARQPAETGAAAESPHNGNPNLGPAEE